MQVQPQEKECTQLAKVPLDLKLFFISMGQGYYNNLVQLYTISLC